MADNEGLEVGSAAQAASGFQSFENAAADIVLAAAYNSSSTRLALASADHKIRIYEILGDNNWSLLDQYRGHDAEILDIQWIDSSLGHFFATIASDNKFKLWREDSSQPRRSGRRFKCIFSQSPPDQVSYVSFEFTVQKHDVWLSLMTHRGLLSLLEPTQPELLNNWREVDSLYPFGQYYRGIEPMFSISFHHAEAPSSQAVAAGFDRDSLSLAVSAFHCVKIYRRMKAAEGIHQLKEMIEIVLDTPSINQIAWAPGCLRFLDVIAAACDDGTVRILEITVPRAGVNFLGVKAPLSSDSTERASDTAHNPPSGIGAGLAELSRSASVRSVADDSHMKHDCKEVAVLLHGDRGPVWKVRWDFDGSILASTGDDSRVHLWKQGLGGQYVEFAETGPG